jgi:class 3 adenylate cyclase
MTFLFTDIEGSSRMWERSPQVMQAALGRHDKILMLAIEEHGGYVFKTVGDAFCAAWLWGAAQALHEAKNIPRDTDFLAEADARISAVRSGMGEEAWEEAWRQGREMTLDEAVSYSLEGEVAASG